MPLAIVCDEHIPYAVSGELRRKGYDVATVQQIGLRSHEDARILDQIRDVPRIVYTCDDDYLRINATGVPHSGILYHAADKYSIGDAIRAVSAACERLTMEEMRNRVEYL